MNGLLINIIRTLSKVLSLVFFPMFVPTYAIIILLFISPYAQLPLAYRFILLGETTLITCGIPIFYVWMLIKQGIVKNFYIEDKKQRTIPYIISIVSGIMWTIILFKSGLQACIWLSALGSVVSLMIVTVITHFWKISAHLTMMGCLLGAFLSFFLQNKIFPLPIIMVLLCIALVLMWARIFLNAHTSMQTVAGYLLGILVTFLPTAIYISYTKPL